MEYTPAPPPPTKTSTKLGVIPSPRGTYVRTYGIGYGPDIIMLKRTRVSWMAIRRGHISRNNFPRSGTDGLNEPIQALSETDDGHPTIIVTTTTKTLFQPVNVYVLRVHLMIMIYDKVAFLIFFDFWKNGDFQCSNLPVLVILKS